MFRILNVCVLCLCRLQRQRWSTQNKETVTFLMLAGTSYPPAAWWWPRPHWTAPRTTPGRRGRDSRASSRIYAEKKTSRNTTNGRRLVVLLPGNITAKPVVRLLTNPIWAGKSHHLFRKCDPLTREHGGKNNRFTSKYAKQMRPAHMSEWPMSSRVVEAVRYLKEEHNRGRSSKCFVLLRNRAWTRQ